MQALRLVTVLVTALAAGLTFSHLLQLPPRMGFDGTTWITTQRVFPLYGSVGAVLEIASVVLAVVLAYAVWNGPGFGWVLAAAALLGATLAVWIAFVAPANTHISQWTADNLPADWQRWRAQWEYAHAARAGLQVVGLGCLVRSILVAPKGRHSSNARAVNADR